ncbi:MAG: SIMPL domain-containing protein [Clostridia bacterium]|nr:SIMPL domain-containing protein [Clostridia bacterium]
MMRTIRVTGKGSIKIHPDAMRITVTLTELNKDYSGALKHSSESTEKLKDLLSSFGFKKTDLKTLNFNVDTEYEGYTEKGVYKQKFAGYRYRHTMKVEFDSDNERLGKVLYALAGSELHPEFNISYIVKDRESAKNELLARAVSDAKEKASVLARAAELTLGEIQSVDYSWGEMNMEIRPMNGMMQLRKMSDNSAEESYAIDMEPDDIGLSDTVTVIWDIS